MSKAKITTEFTVCAWCIKTVESMDDVCDNCQFNMWTAFMTSLAAHQKKHNTWRKSA